MSRTSANIDEKTGVVEDDFLNEINLCLVLTLAFIECLLFGKQFGAWQMFDFCLLIRSS